MQAIQGDATRPQIKHKIEEGAGRAGAGGVGVGGGTLRGNATPPDSTTWNARTQMQDHPRAHAAFEQQLSRCKTIHVHMQRFNISSNDAGPTRTHATISKLTDCCIDIFVSGPPSLRFGQTSLWYLPRHS